MIYNGIQVGLTSFGAAVGCEVGYPDAFTRISYFRDWIFTHTGIWIKKYKDFITMLCSIVIKPSNQKMTNFGPNSAANR